eukprot:191448-Rhodomonas_salina.3
MIRRTLQGPRGYVIFTKRIPISSKKACNHPRTQHQRQPPAPPTEPTDQHHTHAPLAFRAPGRPCRPPSPCAPRPRSCAPLPRSAAARPPAPLTLRASACGSGCACAWRGGRLEGGSRSVARSTTRQYPPTRSSIPVQRVSTRLRVPCNASAEPHEENGRMPDRAGTAYQVRVGHSSGRTGAASGEPVPASGSAGGAGSW